MEDFEAALKRLVKDRLERGETPFAVARHMLLAAAALLSVHEKLADQEREPEAATEPDTMPWQGWKR